MTSSGRNASRVATGIFVSRIVAVVRESFLAAYLGTRLGGDAFGAALRIPKVLQNLLGEGALSASFIPIYSQLLEEGDQKRARNVAGAVLGLLILLVGALTVLTVLLARPIVLILAPGFSGEKYELTITLLRIMAPGIGLIVLAAWCLGVLNSHRKFFLSYVAPAFWSIAIIIACAIAALANWTEMGIARSVAYGVLIGGGIQFLAQLPFALKVAGHIRITFSLRAKAVRQVFTRFGPAVAGRGVVTLGSYIDLILASLLATGAVAILDRAHALYLFPISIFALSIAAADLPEISREHRSPEKVRERIMLGGRRIMFFLLFMTIIFIAGGHSIVSAIYERVNFTSDDTLIVWLVLATYCLGMLASGLSRILQNASYGLGDVKNPARIALVRMVVSVVLGVILMLQFDRFGILNGEFFQTGNLPAFSTQDVLVTKDGTEFRHLGAIGLALGAMFGSWIEFALLKELVRRKLGKERLLFIKNLGKILLGAIVSATIAIALSIATSGINGLLAAPIVVFPSSLAYVLIAAKFQSPEAKGLLKRVRNFNPFKPKSLGRHDE